MTKTQKCYCQTSGLSVPHYSNDCKQRVFTPSQFELLFDALSILATETRALYDCQQITKREEEKKQKSISLLERKLENL